MRGSYMYLQMVGSSVADPHAKVFNISSASAQNRPRISFVWILPCTLPNAISNPIATISNEKDNIDVTRTAVRIVSCSWVVKPPAAVAFMALLSAVTDSMPYGPFDRCKVSAPRERDDDLECHCMRALHSNCVCIADPIPAGSWVK